jgi:flagellar hook assembly protein FlgD
VPKTFGLSQNYPNPFNPSTTVTFEVPSQSNVELAIYDVAGKLVAVLVEDRRAPGTYTAHWDGRDRMGQPVASGMYFVRMRAGSFVQTRKLLLIK